MPAAASSAIPPWLTLQELRRLTGFDKRSVVGVLRSFSEHHDLAGCWRLDKLSFDRTLTAIVSRQYIFLAAKGTKRLKAVLRFLFTLFDTGNNGFVTRAEALGGLTVLCRKQDSADALFLVHDSDRDGYVECADIEAHLAAALRMLFQLDESIESELGCGHVTETVRRLVKQAFKARDRVNRAEFKVLFLLFTSIM